MTLSTYRNSPYWKAAIDLGSSVARLADELPAAEEFGMSAALRKSAVALPAAIATDLLEGSQANRRFRPVLKLAAALDLVDRVYPALDTAATRSALEALVEELSAGDFGAVAPAASTPAPAPVTVPVATEAPEVPAPAASTPAAPAVTPIIQESHVQPDSQE